MKIPTSITTVQRVSVDITPQQAIEALKAEIVKRINQELISLKLPKEELDIPHGGFQEFYLSADGVPKGYHIEGRHPRETETKVEIKWGVPRFTRMINQIMQLDNILSSDTFSH